MSCLKLLLEQKIAHIFLVNYHPMKREIWSKKILLLYIFQSLTHVTGFSKIGYFGKLIILLTKLLPYLALKYCIFYISVNVFSLGTGEEMLHRHEWVTTWTSKYTYTDIYSKVSALYIPY